MRHVRGSQSVTQFISSSDDIFTLPTAASWFIQSRTHAHMSTRVATHTHYRMSEALKMCVIFSTKTFVELCDFYFFKKGGRNHIHTHTSTLTLTPAAHIFSQQLFLGICFFTSFYLLKSTNKMILAARAIVADKRHATELIKFI